MSFIKLQRKLSQKDSISKRHADVCTQNPIGYLMKYQFSSICCWLERSSTHIYRGKARLGDSNWSVGTMQGLADPRRLFHDCRVIKAFTLSLVVIALGLLTVL